MDLRRRELIAWAPAAGLAGVLAAGDAKGVVTHGTSDENGMPRARPVGIGEPTDDWSLWIATKRGSRKTRQIASNPKAALHFGFDDIPNGHKNSFYASFAGLASVHTDAANIGA